MKRPHSGRKEAATHRRGADPRPYGWNRSSHSSPPLRLPAGESATELSVNAKLCRVAATGNRDAPCCLKVVQRVRFLMALLVVPHGHHKLTGGGVSSAADIHTSPLGRRPDRGLRLDEVLAGEAGRAPKVPRAGCDLKHDWGTCRAGDDLALVQNGSMRRMSTASPLDPQIPICFCLLSNHSLPGALPTWGVVGQQRRPM